MIYRVDNASKRVDKQILKLPTDYRNLVVKKILGLETNPRPYGVQKLADNIYRLKVGRYRIIYEIDDDKKLVVITKVDKRSESTYKNIT